MQGKLNLRSGLIPPPLLSIGFLLALSLVPWPAHASAGAAEWETEFTYNRNLKLRQYYIDGVCETKGCFDIVGSWDPKTILSHGKFQIISLPSKRNLRWVLAKNENNLWVVIDAESVQVISESRDFATAKSNLLSKSPGEPQLVSAQDLRKHFHTTLLGWLHKHTIWLLILFYAAVKFFTFGLYP